jgi:multiple sugar transport system permease protein
MAIRIGKRASLIIGDTVTYLFLTFVGFIILIPIFWMLTTALKADGDVFLFPPRWFSDRLYWENFRRGLSFLPFARYFGNTAYITLLAVAGQLLSSPVIAYGFAKLRARARNVLFVLLLSTMMLPYHVTMIPVFLVYRKFNAIDTYWPLILHNFFGAPYYIFLLRQFLLTIPQELSDAAKIDGCGYFGTFARIFLPLSKPALATVAIFTFMNNWNDFMGPLIYISTDDKWTLTLGLSRFTGMYGQTAWNQLMGVSLIVILPSITLFFFAQRLFIQGIVITGVKG